MHRSTSLNQRDLSLMKTYFLCDLTFYSDEVKQLLKCATDQDFPSAIKLATFMLAALQLPTFLSTFKHKVIENLKQDITMKVEN